ncbi:MAG: glycosyltransferase [Bacteroidota bacterium]
MEYLVDVIVPTYNHEKYIGTTIESIVTQQTNFPFRLIVSDDCSKDRTREIVAEYAAKYPDILFPVYHPKNVGAVANGYSLLSAVTAKYLAVCDGDDYWTDPLKLQKQVDFLEANPDFSMCFTEVEILDELKSDKIFLQPEHIFPPMTKDVFTVEDFIMADMNMVPTPTLVMRNVLPRPIPDFYLHILGGDLFMQMVATDKGKAKYMREKTAVYRNHGGGVSKSKESIARGEHALVELYHHLNKFFSYRYDKLFKKRLLDIARGRLIFGARDKKGLARIKHYFKNIPDYLKYSDKINFKELAYYHVVLFFPFLLRRGKG